MDDDAEVIAAVKRLKRAVAPRIPIERAILFGSRARGDARPSSDVDLLVVSPYFEGKSAGERALELYLAWDLDLPVDFLCYSPRELAERKDRITIAHVALGEGVEIPV